MDETFPVRPPELEPGTIIEFGDISELPAFEDVIAPFVEPDYDQDLWLARPPINEALRPRVNGRLFYGRLGNITLTVMSKPYERLLDARERGWTLQKGGGRARTGIDAADRVSHYLGFEFSAMAFSSTQITSVGAVAAELWYYPVPRNGVQGQLRIIKRKTASGAIEEQSYTAKSDYINPTRDEAVRRIVTNPKFEAGKFIELDERSRRIGSKILQQAISHPLRSGMESKRLEH